MIPRLTKLPFLFKLDLSSNGRITTREDLAERIPEEQDISDSLVIFLAGVTQRLRSLNLTGFVVDHKQLCESLKQNTCLRELKVEFPGMTKKSTVEEADEFYLELLRKHNATLKVLHDAHMTNYGIEYFLRLNEMGRADLRIPGFLSRGEVISTISDALPRVQQQDFRRFRFLARGNNFDIETHSLFYDLLRDSVANWCEIRAKGEPKTQFSRKRKWANTTLTSVIGSSDTNSGTIKSTSTIENGQLIWYKSQGHYHRVDGRIKLQRFGADKTTPFFRIVYNGELFEKNGWSLGPAGGALHFPMDVTGVTQSHGYKAGFHWVNLTFPQNDECLDAIHIWIPQEKDSDEEVRLLVEAIDCANQERDEYLTEKNTDTDDNA